MTTLDPAPALLARLFDELPAFGREPGGDRRRHVRVARAPGRLDVMGGIADYTGALVCEMPLACGAAVALAPRDDRSLQVFSFNLLDEHKPFTARIDLGALANTTAEALARDFAADAQRRWAAYMVGCLFVLHEQGYIDLRNPAVGGLDLAVHSTVPRGAGVSSSAALEVATMMALADHFGLRTEPTPALAPWNYDTGKVTGPNAPPPIDGLRLAALCQQVENRIAGAPCGIMDQVTCCLGEPGALLRLRCQPHELREPLALPPGVRVVGVNTGVRHSVAGGQYGRTRTAAFMGHRMILAKMKQIGEAAGRELSADPMHGYLANLPLKDYKDYFRGFLPESMRGERFLAEYGMTIDPLSRVDPAIDYAVQSATDHHVHEADRVRNFVSFVETANRLEPHTEERSKYLDMAGHLMYASHVSYTRDAQLGAPECDVLVDLVRKMERRARFYGAKVTGGGQGGTVAVLCADGERTDTGLQELMAEYQRQTGRTATLIAGTSPGAWWAGTAMA